MYQVIVYDCSASIPKVIDRTLFENEECAWAWYDTVSNYSVVYDNGQPVNKKRVEFKCGSNSEFVSY